MSLDSPPYTPKRITCPACGSRDTTTVRVIKVEVVDPTEFVYRRKKCRTCGYEFTTSETHHPAPIGDGGE